MSQRRRSTLPHFLPYRTATTVQAIRRPDEGGWASFEDGQLKIQVRLPRAIFNLVAVLIQAGQRAANGSSPSSDGFITTAELARKLGQMADIGPGDLPPDNQQVNKYIYRLRRILDRALQETMEARPRKRRRPIEVKPNGSTAARRGPKTATQGRHPDSWSNQVIEYQRFLGYRLSTPASHLHLEIIEDGEGNNRLV